MEKRLDAGEKGVHVDVDHGRPHLAAEKRDGTAFSSPTGRTLTF